MAIVAYSQQNEFDLVNSGQDCMGWAVTDQTGKEIGKVTEMLIETEEMKIDSIMVTGGVRVPAEDIALRDGRVVVRGVSHGAENTGTQPAATGANATTQNYAPVQREANAQHVAGVTRAANENEVSIPIIEEKLTVGKRTVDTGAVRVRTEIEERPVEQQVNLREEHVRVDRRPMDRPVDANTSNAFQEGSFDVTTQTEVPVVSKQARVVEEVVVDKEMIERTETVRDTVKRTDVEVDRVDSDANPRRPSDR